MPPAWRPPGLACPGPALQVCLLEQVFVKDSDFTVKQIIENKAKALGKEIKIAGVQRFEVGEGIEKKEENFAEEVAKQLGN